MTKNKNVKKQSGHYGPQSLVSKAFLKECPFCGGDIDWRLFGTPGARDIFDMSEGMSVDSQAFEEAKCKKCRRVLGRMYRS